MVPRKAVRAALAAALIGLTGTVAACGGSDSSSGGGGGQSLRGTTITYWASNQGATMDQDKQVLTKAVARFKQQTGVTVNFKVIPWSDLWNNITTATTSGRGPDVLNIGNTWSASLQATGAFLPFTGEDLQAIGGKDKFVQTSLAASGAPGKDITSVPLYGLSYGLFYNKKLFRQAGIASPPKTWSEFVADAKKLTKDANGDGKVDQWGVAVEGASLTENAHWAFILGRQNGGRLFDASGKPTFTAPPIVKGVQSYVDLMDSDKVASPSNAQYSDGTQTLAQFAKGKAGMVLWQNNAENNIKADGMKSSEYGVAEVPVMDGSSTPIMTHVAGINLSIFQNTKNKDAALAFVKFMTSPQEQVTLNQAFSSLPVVTAATKDEAFQTHNLKVFNDILANHAEPMPLIPQEGQMETLIGSAVKDLFSQAATKGNVTTQQVQAALNNANQKMAAASGS
jgi:multiple sugar transport system substrate-binding protein